MASRLKLRKRNWLHETRSQETARRIHALEHSLQEAHLRINELDQHISGLALLFGSKTVHRENLSDVKQPRAMPGDVILAWGDRPISQSEADMLNESRGHKPLGDKP